LSVRDWDDFERCKLICSFKQRIFTYASTTDRILYALGFTGAIAVGAALPLMTLVFGQSTAEFNQQATGQDRSNFTSNINRLVLYFVYLFVARFVIGYLGTLCICIAAARTTCALREDFLDKLLRQDVAHFDKDGSGSAATQVTTSEQRNLEAFFVLLMALSRW
jgi:ATP-binding cassette subfamily B (MDR/TAP) protein 1